MNQVNEEFSSGWTSSALATFTGKDQITHQYITGPQKMLKAPYETR